MKKIYLLAGMALISLTLFSQTDWKKYASNPVLTPGSSGEWDYKGVMPGSVLYLDSAYHLWYWGENAKTSAIGYASSPDGVSWTKQAENPVLEPGPAGSWDAGRIMCPSVLYHNGVFHMWYTAADELVVNENIHIGHATSTDGINWTKDSNNPVLKTGAEGTWDQGWICLGSVIFDGGVFKMYYEGYKGAGGDNLVRIGYATSPDGIAWNKGPENPILVPDQGTWDYPRLDAPYVLHDGSSYKMWYLGGEFKIGQTGYATSEDGMNWTMNEGNPVLKTGPAGSWDDSSLGWHAIIDSASIKYKMWFGGLDDPNGWGRIGYAESDTRVPILTLQSETLLDTTMTLEVETNLDASVYLLPMDTKIMVDSILQNAVRSAEAVANATTAIPLTGISPGSYCVAAISDYGFVCYRGVEVQIRDDINPPEILLQKESIGIDEPIIATSSKDGVVFLVEGTTPSQLVYIRSSRFLIDSAEVQADVPVEFTSENWDSGVYKLFAMDTYGMLSTSKTILVGGVGIHQPVSGQNWVSIYPNPADNLLSIHLLNQGNYRLRILALSGQEVIVAEWQGASREIDLTPLDAGVYVIRVETENLRWAGKLVKLK